MINLFNFGPFGNLPDPSPFCLKIDAYMRMAGLDYESASDVRNLRNAPKGKLPYITDQGMTLGDSAFILDYLKQTYGDPLDANLTEEQLAVQHAFVKMLDENLYWCLVWSRWISDSGWPGTKNAFFGDMPWFLRAIVPNRLRKGMRRTLHRQGLGRHSESEIKQIMRNDLQALSTYLDQKPYFFGNEPATLDAVAFGFLAEFVLSPVDTTLTSIAKEYKNLLQFCERVQARWYSLEPGKS